MGIKLAQDRLGSVGDAMTEVVCIIDEGASVGEAIVALGGVRHTGAPVVRGEQVVGVVSQTDLLSAAPEAGVADVMTHTVFAVRPSDPLLLAVRLMVEQGIHRVVVVDEGGGLQGVVSAMDVLQVLASHAISEEALDYVDLRNTKAR